MPTKTATYLTTREGVPLDLSRTRPVPRYLYRYMSLDGERQGWAQDTIIRRTLYLASPAVFNDPFDSKICVDLETPQEFFRQCEEGLSAMQATEGLLQQRWLESASSATSEKMSRDMAAIETTTRDLKDLAIQAANRCDRLRQEIMHGQEIIERLAIVCFAEQPDNILMWSHYSAGHTGICLEFDTSVAFGEVVNVRYQDSYPKLDAIEFLCTKSRHWEYEREWRLIREINEAERLYSFPADGLVSVICGCRMPDDAREIVKSWAAEGHVLLKHAARARNRYALNITVAE